jgi:hypothetical protein
MLTHQTGNDLSDPHERTDQLTFILSKQTWWLNHLH